MGAEETQENEAPVCAEETPVPVPDPVTAEETPVPAPEACADPPQPVIAPSSSFKEESYHLKDLKEPQKKALLDLKAKIRAAIVANSFLEAPKPISKKESEAAAVVVAQESEEACKKESEDDASKEVGEACSDSKEGTCPIAKGDVSEASVVVVTEEECTTDEAQVESASRDIPCVTDEAVTAPEEATLEEEDDTPPEDVSLWGIPLLNSKGDERTDVILLKFLRAREFKVDKALSMLQDTVSWRREYDADVLVDEDVDTEFNATFIHGVDRQGRPVCYNTQLRSRKSVDDEADLKKRLQVLEKAIAQKLDFHPNGVHSMVHVTDFSGYSSAFLNSGVISRILSLLQDNYPELAAKQIFINVPWRLGAFVSLHNVSPRTKSKVVTARPDKVAETLFKYISPSHVPVQYGGFSRPNDTEFESVEAELVEVTVKPGEKHIVEFEVSEAESTVTWDLTVIGWGVLYEEEFVPVEGYTVRIRKAEKISAHEEPIRNSFVAHELGKIVLTIDNSASKRKRTLIHRHYIKKASTIDC